MHLEDHLKQAEGVVCLCLVAVGEVQQERESLILDL